MTQEASFDVVAQEGRELTAELRRLEDLRERTDLLQQLVEASFLEAEDAVASGSERP